MYWKIFSSSLLLLSFVYVNAQVPTRTNPRDVVIDANRQELDNLLLRKPILTAEDNSVRQATLKQINEDFKAVQALNNQVMSKVTSAEQLDYKLISNKISELGSKATRLRKNLVLPKAEKHTKSLSTISTSAELKQALLEFDKVVVSFVSNPIFKQTQVIEVDLAKQASRDLELLIKQSESLKKAASRLQNQAR